MARIRLFFASLVAVCLCTCWASSVFAEDVGQTFNDGALVLVSEHPIGLNTGADPRAVTAGAVYSNITRLALLGTKIGGATGSSGTRVTKLLADDIQCVSGGGGDALTAFTFSVANLNTSGSFSCYSMIRFYADNADAPGSYLGGFNLPSRSFTSNTVSLVTYTVPTAQQFTIPASGKMWIGTAFYITTGGSSATTSLNNMGVGLYSPVDVGSSADEDFLSTSNGGSSTTAFQTGSPPGSVRIAPYTVPACHGFELSSTLGACCLSSPTLSCSVMLRNGCVAAGGTYLGANTTCSGPDCNTNGRADTCDIATGTSQDCNTDGIPDECELAGRDCNGNGVPDECDVTAGTSHDCNANGIPDECEPGGTSDCSNNGIPDLCDLFLGTSHDCNHNSIPDECDIAQGTSQDSDNDGWPNECEPDCNTNGVPDALDIAGGTSQDCNGNGIPDECDVVGAGNALHCEGVDVDTYDFVTIPGAARFNFGTSDFTIEMWVQPDVMEGDYRMLFCNQIADNWQGNRDPSGALQFYGGGATITSSPLSWTIGQWYHVAWSRYSGTVHILRDGEIITSGAAAGSVGNMTAINLGYRPVTQGHPWHGAIDEVRIWNYGRTPALIAADMNKMLRGDEPGLIGYWRFDETAGQSILDASMFRNHGTLGKDGTPGSDDPSRIPSGALGGRDVDCNSNGVPDECDVSSGTSEDCNNNQIPDECERDCNDNGIPDDCDLSSGLSEDCNGNQIPDECEPDCNGNGSPDDCDVTGGLSEDCNGNQIPDECELNGHDCNHNQVPDECEVSGTTDCNHNGIVDLCDLYNGTSEDCNADGVPDECQAGMAGNAVHYDGTNDVLTIPGRTIYTFGTSDFTIEMWVRPDLLEGNSRVLFCNQTLDNWQGYINGGGLEMAFSGGGKVVLSGSLPWLLGEWYHCAWTRSAGSLTILCNGVDVASGTVTGALGNGSNISIGFRASTQEHPWMGAIDEIRVWSCARTASQIQTTMHVRLLGNESGLIGYWRCDEGSGQALVDDSPSANTAMLGATLAIGGDDPARIASGRFMNNRDCNANGIFDDCDITTGTSMDCNGNHIPDECEGAGRDCNGNGVLDECDIIAGTSADCNSDLVPDECQVEGNDCNDNGIPDDCEAGGTSDCNGDGVSDLCDIYAGTSLDCNSNHVPDACDIAGGTSSDVNNNSIPDDCETDVRVVPVVTLINPAGTAEVRTSLPASLSQVMRSSAYYLEIWASDVGTVNTGLTGVYVDVNFCSATTASEVFHGGIFTTFALGTIQAHKVDEFGGSALPHGGGIEPQWVRVGWIRMNAGLAAPSCAITLTAGSHGIGAYARGLINPAFVRCGSVNLEISPPMVSYDLDNDAFIGLGDLSLFAASWLKAVPPGQTAHDFDCDDFVGVSDLSWFATGWQKYTNDPTILYALCTGKTGFGETRNKNGTDVDLRLIAKLSQTGYDTTTVLPTSIQGVALGQTYYVELWASDVGEENTGLTSVYVDLGFASAATTLLNIQHGSTFTVFPSGTNNSAGLIDELGGSTLPGGVGMEPEWARVAAVRVQAIGSAPAATYHISPSSTGVAALARGTIPWAAIARGSVAVRQGILGDIDGDGDKDSEDIQLFVAVVLATETMPTYVAASDFTGDGVVNGLDVQPFVNAMVTP